MTLPQFGQQVELLVRLMQKQTITDLQGLMDLSLDLAELNYSRYQNFHFGEVPHTSCHPALFLFQGDVYKGLEAKTWSLADIDYAQHHLAILSGLYGVLKPLDAIQPYRLEMGVRLQHSHGSNLYDFWGDSITNYLNDTLANEANPMLINLASTEYFKVVKNKKINYPIVTVNFYEQKNNVRKIIGIYAKKARGLMAKYLIQQRIEQLADIQQFNEHGYSFDKQSSSADHLDFVRVHE